MCFLKKRIYHRIFWNYPKLTTLLVGLLIFLLLSLFRPYEFRFFNTTAFIQASLLCSALGSFTYYLGFTLFEKKITSNWHYWKDTLLANLMFVLYANLNYISFYLLNNFTNGAISNDPQSLTYLESYEYTYKVGSLLYLIILLSDYMRKKASTHSAVNEANLESENAFSAKPPVMNEHAVNQTESLNTPTEQSKATSDDSLHEEEETIMLVGKNNDDFIQLNPNSIINVKAIGNYLELSYLTKNEKIKSQILRNSIKNLCQQLNEVEFIYCCHRSHLINLQYVSKVVGNSKSKKAIIIINDTKIEVPISRLKNTEFEEIRKKVTN